MKQLSFGSVFSRGKSGNYDISEKVEDLPRRTAVTQVICFANDYFIQNSNNFF